MSNDEGGGIINNERIEIPNTLFNTIKFKICNKLTMGNIMKKDIMIEKWDQKNKS